MFNDNYSRIESDNYGQNDNDEFEFRQKASAISSSMEELKRNVNSIKRIEESIGTSKDDISFFEKMKTQQNATNHLAHQIGDDLKKLACKRASNPTDQRIRETQIEKLSNGLSLVLGKFQSTQRIIAIKERATVDAALSHAETPSLLPEFEQHQDQIQDQRVDFIPLEEIMERQEAITKIEQDIMGVNEIMTDLAVMIQEQGHVVDSIESHVELTLGNVQAGNIALSQARQYQSSNRKRNCFLVLGLALILAVILGIIYFNSTSKKN